MFYKKMWKTCIKTDFLRDGKRFWVFLFWSKFIKGDSYFIPDILTWEFLKIGTIPQKIDKCKCKGISMEPIHINVAYSTFKIYKIHIYIYIHYDRVGLILLIYIIYT